ncbi:hypothetical protein AAJ76_1160004947 [Vairimorpha ceranae]|uniref:Uncharacterized protein n=1 Tax=Vairimorpha ceranae TaxID=40302 RepID=A0A0F9WM19_9MICR|nr:hypothetical protein AAJ76_1160004947 [Vairimorpha ceranae]KKO74118.1 hypothetical protein AAJ76_1160004947 [Vairimorpha ceranae]
MAEEREHLDGILIAGHFELISMTFRLKILHIQQSCLHCEQFMKLKGSKKS